MNPTSITHLFIMANAKETSPAKHTFRIIMTETRTWWLDVEAKDVTEATEISEKATDNDWNQGDSDFEIDEVVQLTKECVCGAIMAWDDLNECWDCTECYTAMGPDEL